MDPAGLTGKGMDRMTKSYSLGELYATMVPRSVKRHLTSRLLWWLAVRLAWLATKWAEWMEGDDGQQRD